MRNDLRSQVKRIIASFMKRFFFLLYHHFAWTYDGVAWIVSLGRWKTWVYSILPFLDRPRILELGHGPGHLQAALNNNEVWSCGLDESWWMSRIASRRCDHLVNGNAQTLPFANEVFEKVVATFPADFIFEKKTLLEVYRVLVPGGEFIVLPVAWITGRQAKERLAAWLFHITEQAPEKNVALLSKGWVSLFEKALFQVEIRIEQVFRSELLLLIARKPDQVLDGLAPPQRT